MKILLNAEAFGFGPSAAVAEIFKHLKAFPFVEQIDYVGNGHTLDLQAPLPYHQLFKIEQDEDLKAIVADYDVFITALDFHKATIAKEMGVCTIIYDTLLWYWRKIPTIIKECDHYIAQDFYGVQERISELNLKNYSLIAPLINCTRKNAGNTHSSSSKNNPIKNVLINFGGLENPHWDISVTTQYIHGMLNALLPLLKDKKVKVTCSKNHHRYLQGIKIENFNYQQMQETLSTTDLLIATPGLGNIYEAACYGMNSLFLPPANDSQGQQQRILHANGLMDNFVDWNDMGQEVNYFSEQRTVLSQLKTHISQMDILHLQTLFQEKIHACNTNAGLGKLIGTFGINGSESLAQILHDCLSHDLPKKQLIC